MDAVKEKITGQALDLFINIGVRSVTMDMISSKLGISKKTLYEHFSSKEELIKITFFEYLFLAQKEIEDKNQAAKNAIHQQLLILKNSKNLFLINEKQISFQLEKFYPEIYIEILDFQKKSIKNLIKNNLILGIEEQLYRSKLKKNIVIEYFYLIQSVIEGRDESLDIVSQNYFIDLLLRSITTKKGVKELEKIMKLE